MRLNNPNSRLDKLNKRDDLVMDIAKWFAIYTKPRQEKIVEKQLLKQKIEYYLPYKKELRQWSDRKKWVETPLFPSYIFVKITTKEYSVVKGTHGVLKFVNFSGERLSIREEEIALIRRVETSKCLVEVAQDTAFTIGAKVEITEGILAGESGKLVTIAGKDRVGIEIESLGCFLSIEIERKHLKVL